MKIIKKWICPQCEKHCCNIQFYRKVESLDYKILSFWHECITG